MIYKYKANPWTWRIIKVEIDRETPKAVFIKGRRISKFIRDGEVAYFDNFRKAKAYLVRLAREQIEWADFRLEQAQDRLYDLKKLREKKEG